MAESHTTKEQSPGSAAEERSNKDNDPSKQETNHIINCHGYNTWAGWQNCACPNGHNGIQGNQGNQANATTQDGGVLRDDGTDPVDPQASQNEQKAQGSCCCPSAPESQPVRNSRQPGLRESQVLPSNIPNDSLLEMVNNSPLQKAQGVGPSQKKNPPKSEACTCCGPDAEKRSFNQQTAEAQPTKNRRNGITLEIRECSCEASVTASLPAIEENAPTKTPENACCLCKGTQKPETAPVPVEFEDLESKFSMRPSTTASSGKKSTKQPSTNSNNSTDTKPKKSCTCEIETSFSAPDMSHNARTTVNSNNAAAQVPTAHESVQSQGPQEKQPRLCLCKQLTGGVYCLPGSSVSVPDTRAGKRGSPSDNATNTNDDNRMVGRPQNVLTVICTSKGANTDSQPAKEEGTSMMVATVHDAGCMMGGNYWYPEHNNHFFIPCKPSFNDEWKDMIANYFTYTGRFQGLRGGGKTCDCKEGKCKEGCVKFKQTSPTPSGTKRPSDISNAPGMMCVCDVPDCKRKSSVSFQASKEASEDPTKLAEAGSDNKIAETIPEEGGTKEDDATIQGEGGAEGPTTNEPNVQESPEIGATEEATRADTPRPSTLSPEEPTSNAGKTKEKRCICPIEQECKPHCQGKTTQTDANTNSAHKLGPTISSPKESQTMPLGKICHCPAKYCHPACGDPTLQLQSPSGCIDEALKEHPTEDTSTEKTPSEAVPSEEPPVEEIAAEGVPADDTPLDEAPPEEVETEAPTATAPPDEEPLEEAPPVEAQTVEEAPTEEVLPEETTADPPQEGPPNMIPDESCICPPNDCSEESPKEEEVPKEAATLELPPEVEEPAEAPLEETIPPEAQPEDETLPDSAPDNVMSPEAPPEQEETTESVPPLAGMESCICPQDACIAKAPTAPAEEAVAPDEAQPEKETDAVEDAPAEEVTPTEMAPPEEAAPIEEAAAEEITATEQTAEEEATIEDAKPAAEECLEEDESCICKEVDTTDQMQDDAKPDQPVGEKDPNCPDEVCEEVSTDKQTEGDITHVPHKPLDQSVSIAIDDKGEPIIVDGNDQQVVAYMEDGTPIILPKTGIDGCLTDPSKTCAQTASQLLAQQADTSAPPEPAAETIDVPDNVPEEPPEPVPDEAAADEAPPPGPANTEPEGIAEPTNGAGTDGADTAEAITSENGGGGALSKIRSCLEDSNKSCNIEVRHIAQDPTQLPTYANASSLQEEEVPAKQPVDIMPDMVDKGISCKCTIKCIKSACEMKKRAMLVKITTPGTMPNALKTPKPTNAEQAAMSNGALRTILKNAPITSCKCVGTCNEQCDRVKQMRKEMTERNSIIGTNSNPRDSATQIDPRTRSSCICDASNCKGAQNQRN